MKWETLVAAPWNWGADLLSLGVMMGALALIDRSTKFLKKDLWSILSFLSPAFYFGGGPDTLFAVSIPVGAACIVGFWIFGPAPTAAQQARDAERRAMRALGTKWRTGALKAAYAVALAASLAIVWVMISGAVEKLFATSGSPKAWMSASNVSGRAALTPHLAAIGLLVLRPYWWGKLLCVWAGVCWLGFALIGSSMWGMNAALAAILAAGAAMLMVAIVHQILDPRFGGYLRSENPSSAAPRGQ